MAAQPINFQSQVHAKYWRVRTAIAQPILDTEHAAFNRKLLDNELSPAWALVFRQGRTDVTFPMHLMSIIIKLQPAADKGSLQSINTANISPDDPECQTSKAYQKGYIVPNNTITSDHPIGNNRWWEDFHQQYVAAATQRADQERMAKEEELAQRQRKAKEKEEAKQATAVMQAVAEELEMKKKKAALTQAKKQVEKQVEKRAREVDTEESEEVEEDAGEDRGRRASRAISISTGPSRARTPSRASKRVKRTPSEDDGQPRSDEDEAEPNLLDVFYDPGKETHASPDAMDEDQPSDEEPEEDELATQPKGQKAKKAKSKGKETWTSPDAMDKDSPSNDDHEELQALVPTVDKGKGRELPLPSLAPAPSLVPAPSQGEVDIVETRTATLVQQMAKQLTDMQGWDAASNEIDQIADAEDIQWDRRLADMDRLLRESHERHLVLKARLADSEQERKAATTESAQARHIITSLQSMYAGMSQFIQFSSNVGGPSGVPPSVLSGQPPPSQ
ncbi:hypothetical protein PAXINDRAFT_16644 [Paxillus involutus ATCC 200175]|uniref:Unplaced genomic scaffold PAXINscaffold_86, whole genome shotgun sequence n=1 Tax=Paxillus involutus ATCC 200175 TaxID=664439 RepID=A0A0C9T3Y5_PAXIN|nr:hypothetical protein PAXINDRAFT_16644 [Paxillus involutus ATCC 200175]